MTDPGTVSVFVLRAFAGVLGQVGVDVPRFLADVGLAPGALDDRDTRIPVPIAFRAFEEAAARTGDPDVALHVAERVPMGAVGFLDYHTRASPTVEEALRRMLRYFALINDRMDVALAIEGDVARLVQRSRGLASRQLAEFHLAMIVVRGRQISGREWPLRAVGFAHAKPADDREHRRFFRCEVRFGQREDSLTFDRAFLDTPLPAADPALSSVLERYGDGVVARLPAGDPFLDDARRGVAELLKSGEASLEALAARLGQSRRTLQRKLQGLGTSHNELVDAVRRDLALVWLADARTSITEVAYLLGFSEPAAFHRAFKRWTGTTPAEHRKARPSVPPPPSIPPPAPR